MCYARRVVWLCCPFFLLTMISGCQSFFDYRPVPVLVLDAETKKPIPDAAVHISYPFTHSNFAPWDSIGMTAGDGIARLQASPSGDHSLLVEAKTKGYLPYTQDISDDAVRMIPARGWFEFGARRAPAFVVEMIAEPRFTIELVVPTHYRGIVKAVVNFQNDVVYPTGQRGFSYEVSLDGEVQVVGPSVLQRYPPLYRARFADGTPLDEKTELMRVGFRWLKRKGDEEYFIVGTQIDYDHFRREMLANPGLSEPSDSGGKGSGKSGRRRGQS